MAARCYAPRVRFGTLLDRDDSGRLVRVVDRGGRIHAEVVWEGDQLVRLDVAGLTVSGRIIRDPLLGEAHVVGDTMMSVVDWHDPERIPTIAAPGKLPAGGGAALLNVLALLADRPLRYAGPYPTPALFRSLCRSFHTTATEDEFCFDAVGRAARLATDVLPFDFVPAPARARRVRARPRRAPRDARARGDRRHRLRSVASRGSSPTRRPSRPPRRTRARRRCTPRSGSAMARTRGSRASRPTAR